MMMKPNILNKNPLMFFDRAVNAQLLGENLTVSACLVEHIHEVGVFKDVRILKSSSKPAFSCNISSGFFSCFASEEALT